MENKASMIQQPPIDMGFVYERGFTCLEIMCVASKNGILKSYKSNDVFHTLTLRVAGGVWQLNIIVTNEVYTVLLLDTVRYRKESDLRTIKEIFHVDKETKTFGTEFYDVSKLVDIFVALDKLEGGY